MTHPFREKQKAEAAARRDELADLVADGLSVAAASKAMGISQQRASQLWQRIKSEVGEV